jgi:hypothetical protein
MPPVTNFIVNGTYKYFYPIGLHKYKIVHLHTPDVVICRLQRSDNAEST